MNNNLVKVTNGVGLARDRNTGTILNINKSEIREARERKELRKQ